MKGAKGGELPFAPGAKTKRRPEESGRSAHKTVCAFCANATKVGLEPTLNNAAEAKNVGFAFYIW
jgi:hypothetical protein